MQAGPVRSGASGRCGAAAFVGGSAAPGGPPQPPCSPPLPPWSPPAAPEWCGVGGEEGEAPPEAPGGGGAQVRAGRLVGFVVRGCFVWNVVGQEHASHRCVDG